MPSGKVVAIVIMKGSNRSMSSKRIRFAFQRTRFCKLLKEHPESQETVIKLPVAWCFNTLNFSKQLDVCSVYPKQEGLL